MKQIINLLKFYYELVGKKLFLLFFLMVAAVGFQGISISLFLPILQGEDSDSKIAQFTRKALGIFGFEYTLLNLLLLLVGFFFLRSIFLVGQASFVGKIMADLLVDLRCKISAKIFELNYQAFIKESIGYYNNVLTVEFPRVVISFKMFSSLMVTILFVLMYVGIPFLFNPALMLVLFGIGIPFFFLTRKINLLTKKYSLQTSAHSGALQRNIIESFKYFKYLKATSKYSNVLRRIFSSSRILGELQFKARTLGAITENGFEPFIVLVIAGVIYYYVGLQGYDSVKIIFLMYLLLSAMKMILSAQNCTRQLLGAWGSIEVLKTIQKELEESKEWIPEEEIPHKVPLDKAIRFENVSFSFNNRAEVLEKINLEIPPNSTVAFVGESGAGKTTFVNLLTGLLRPTEGIISIGEIPYHDFSPYQLRRKIGYMTQENVVFNDTIYNNITLWDSNDSDKSMEMVKSAARKAHIDEFIQNLENGYDSVLGEGGINISGGQRQRICIARELYKDTRILIFDEATSSLDTKTEKEIQKNIDEFKGQKTIVIIAHRLSTVRNSDIIFVLKNGTIVEEGTYEDIYKLNGEFKRMVAQQNS